MPILSDESWMHGVRSAERTADPWESLVTTTVASIGLAARRRIARDSGYRKGKLIAREEPADEGREGMPCEMGRRRHSSAHGTQGVRSLAAQRRRAAHPTYTRPTWRFALAFRFAFALRLAAGASRFCLFALPFWFGVPTIVRRPRRVFGRLDVMRPRPGPVFLDRVAAAGSPALLGRLAAARIILAGKRLIDNLVRPRRHRQTQHRGQIAGQHETAHKPAAERAPGDGSPIPRHGQGSRCATMLRLGDDCKRARRRSRVSR